MYNEITVKELETLNPDHYLLMDVRTDTAFNHGHLPGAVQIDPKDWTNHTDLLDKDKQIIVYCMKGLISADVAHQLSEAGYQAVNLMGGYGAWLVSTIEEKENSEAPLEVEEQRRLKEIEHSLQKKFKKSIFSKFAKAINEYELLQPGDKVAVCISGGKDSMIMAKLFQELKRHNKFQFDLVFMVMDPGYNEYNRKIIENNTRILGIPVTIFESDIFETVFHIEKSPCYLCARMRRGHLYSKAKALGCNKIALGHHYDDVIETTLMGMLYGAQVQTMMPKLYSDNFEGMELIRPMYLIREDDIKSWREYNNLQFIQCACRFTDTCTTDGTDGTGSKRQEIKHLIRDMKKTNPYVESNIFRSMENVKLDTVISYKQKGKVHHFLDTYDDPSSE